MSRAFGGPVLYLRFAIALLRFRRSQLSCSVAVQWKVDMGERAPLLARAVGGKVLGPRPGLAILSFWQGILEIVLRTLALVSHGLHHILLVYVYWNMSRKFSTSWYRYT